MDDAMVTGRMPREKKDEAIAILHKQGLNASQAINMMFDRLIEEKDASFLMSSQSNPTPANWAKAASFVDDLVEPRASRFDNMSKSQIKAERAGRKL